MAGVLDVNKDYTEIAISDDFSIKMLEGTIKSVHDYYCYAQKQSVAFSGKVAKYRSQLKAIEDFESAKDK